MCCLNIRASSCRTERNRPWPALPAAGNVSTLTAAMRISGVGCCTGCGTTVTSWVVKLALVGEIVFLPDALDDLETLNLAVLAFGIGDVQRLIGLHDAAAPNAEDQSALGNVVQGRGFLGDA